MEDTVCDKIVINTSLEDYAGIYEKKNYDNEILDGVNFIDYILNHVFDDIDVYPKGLYDALLCVDIREIKFMLKNRTVTITKFGQY